MSSSIAQVTDTIVRLNQAYILALSDASRTVPGVAAYMFGMSIDEVDQVANMSAERLAALASTTDCALMRLNVSVTQLSELMTAPRELIGLFSASRNLALSN
jgi:hypothetical protein